MARLFEDDLALVHQMRTFRGESALSTWLHTVAVRHFRRQIARIQRQQSHVAETDALPDVAQDPPGDEAELEHRRIEALRRAIEELPEKDRALLRLLVDQEAPTHVVATALGISPDGIRMRKMRVLRKLMKKLKTSEALRAEARRLS